MAISVKDVLDAGGEILTNDPLCCNEGNCFAVGDCGERATIVGDTICLRGVPGIGGNFFRNNSKVSFRADGINILNIDGRLWRNLGFCWDAEEPMSWHDGIQHLNGYLRLQPLIPDKPAEPKPKPSKCATCQHVKVNRYKEPCADCIHGRIARGKMYSVWKDNWQPKPNICVACGQELKEK